MSQKVRKNFIRFGTVLIICVSLMVLLNRQNAADEAINNPFRRTRILEEDENSDLGSPDYDKAKTELHEVLSLIRHRYELTETYGSQFFLSSNNIGKNSWEIIKYKFANMLMGEQNDFLMVFGGSSVTASHDNYYNQSYPAIVQKRLEKIFTTLGKKIIVRNIALGANNCAPYIFCYESMGGEDPDFIGWEQSYNCGRDDPIFETAARIASFSRRKAIVYYSASGAWAPDQCPPSPLPVPYCSENWDPKSENLGLWEPSQLDIESEKAKLFKFYQDKPSAVRFMGSFKNEYTGGAYHGFNVWEQNKNCVLTNPETGKTESCNGIDSTMGCKMKFMSKEAAEYGSDNKKGAKWHPTRAFHMLRGEAIVWLYGMALLDTIHMIVRDTAEGKSEETMKNDYTEKLDKLTPPLPATPKKCGNNYHCQLKPNCYTDFKPHYSKNWTLSELVFGETKWTYDPADYSDWSIHYGYLDSKPIFTAKGPEPGDLNLAITVGKTGFIWVCGLLKDSLKHLSFYVDYNEKDPNWSDLNEKSYKPISDSAKDRIPWEKRKGMGNECEEIFDLPPGKIVLTLSSEKSEPGHSSSLTHVITWP